MDKIWDKRAQSAHYVITISQVKSEEKTNTESAQFRLKPQVDAVSDEKINNLTDGKSRMHKLLWEIYISLNYPH